MTIIYIIRKYGYLSLLFPSYMIQHWLILTPKQTCFNLILICGDLSYLNTALLFSRWASSFRLTSHWKSIFIPFYRLRWASSFLLTDNWNPILIPFYRLRWASSFLLTSHWKSIFIHLKWLCKIKVARCQSSGQ